MQKRVKIVYFIICYCLFFSHFSFALEGGEDIDTVNDMIVMRRAKIRVLNKQLGRVDTTLLDVGDTYRLDNLKISAYACYKSKEYDIPENTMFLSVQYMDHQEDNSEYGEVNIFSGWMFSSSPSLSAMEHPIYDIWLLSCEK